MGAISCNVGSKIRRTPECEIACAQLEMKVGVLKDGRICYRAGNGYCRQDGRIGSKASLICKNEGNKEKYWFKALNSVNNILIIKSEGLVFNNEFHFCRQSVEPSESTKPFQTTARYVQS